MNGHSRDRASSAERGDSSRKKRLGVQEGGAVMDFSEGGSSRAAVCWGYFKKRAKNNTGREDKREKIVQ